MRDWRDAAVCRDHDPEIWFPLGKGTLADLQTAAAKALCRTCPVIDECATWAIDHGQEFGIFGGLTEDERRAVRVGTSQVRIVPPPPASQAEPVKSTRAGGVRRGRPIAETARIITEHAAAGRTRDEIAKALGVNNTKTLNRLIYRARAKGLLPPVTPPAWAVTA